MGSSGSRLMSSPSSSAIHRKKRSIISSLVCGCSASHAPVEMEDYPAEYLVNSAELCNHSSKLHRPHEEYQSSGTEAQLLCSDNETGKPSETTNAENESLDEVGGLDVELGSQDSCMFQSKELNPLFQVSGSDNDGFSTDKNSTASCNSSTSIIEPQSSNQVSVNISCNESAANGIDTSLIEGVSETNPDVTCNSELSAERLQDVYASTELTENRASGQIDNHNSVSNSVSHVSDFPLTFDSQRNGSHSQMTPSGFGFLLSNGEHRQETEGIIHLDVLSVSSSLFSDSSISERNWEAGRGQQTFFWDVLSRDSSGGHRHSSSIDFTQDDTDDRGFHEHWMLDFSDDFSDHSFEGNRRYLRGRSHRSHHRRRRPRSEIWDRLRYGLGENRRRTTFCPSGLHHDGICSCSPSSMTESSTRVSISRIVMLAEALFEVLDEIHHHPIPLSLSMVSLPAPESVVDSFPLKDHKKVDRDEGGENAEQCYICLAEYEDGDKIRVLPCHHEYHVACIDKWLKEIHGICPLCRSDVREGLTEGSLSNPEMHSL